MAFVAISKANAKKRFAKSEPVYLCPNNMRPDGPFSMACLILGAEYLLKAETYRTHPDLWKGTVEATAWDLMYNNWAFYNVDDAEMGTRATYYVQQ